MGESMTRQTATIEAAALEWTIRVQSPEFAEWDALSAWLAADPRHADGFHRQTLLDDEIASVVREIQLRPRPAAGVAKPGLPHRRLPTWALLAAGMALVLTLGALAIGRVRLTAPAPSTRIAVTTRAGERRQVRLADGTEIAVAGATRLWIDPAARSARLEEGQATFSVAHDPARRFVVRMGDATITDVGTVFDLRRREGRSVVAVAQGEVRVDGVGAPVEVTAGRRLRFAGASAPELDVIAPSAATGWQRGYFSYADATVADVVADIEHATGARISLSSQIAAQRFAGTIMITGDAGQALRTVAPVLGLSVSRDGDVWALHSSHEVDRS
jgi:transmembrane sensor